MIESNVGLVLEGGGMRGVYTCGVLEYFMERNLYFNYVIGVSAGACNAVSYISKQKGRNKKVNIDYVKDYRYMSIRNLIKERSFFGMNFIFDEIPNSEVPFDYEAFYKSKIRFLVGVTDCKTGKPFYFEKEDINDKFYPLRASASLPMISPILNIKGGEYLDGGISDSIPILKSIKDGNNKNIIVLTRNIEYRKNPTKFTQLIKLKYRNYPELIEAILNRHKSYNKTLDYIEKLELQGKVIVIRPSHAIKVGRLERNKEKLLQLFTNGYEDAENYYNKIKDFVIIK